jgi:hypothetical protein
MTLTSTTHGDLEYLDVCARAATDDDTFAVFKSLPAYQRVLEHVTREQGFEYLREAGSAFVSQYSTSLRRNDVHGQPSTFDYGHGIGIFSPTTLRYAKVAADLKQLAPPPRRIVEIGGGYGGQRLVLEHIMPRVESYVIVDLPPVLKLIDRYLRTLACTPYSLVSALDDTAIEVIPFADVVISNYALSECASEVQDRYVETILRRSSFGYLTVNEEPTRLVRALASGHMVTVLEEKPKTGPSNSIVFYGPRFSACGVEGSLGGSTIGVIS